MTWRRLRRKARRFVARLAAIPGQVIEVVTDLPIIWQRLRQDRAFRHEMAARLAVVVAALVASTAIGAAIAISGYPFPRPEWWGGVITLLVVALLAGWIWGSNRDYGSRVFYYPIPPACDFPVEVLQAALNDHDVGKPKSRGRRV